MATLRESYTTNDGYLALSENAKKIGLTWTTTARYEMTSVILKMLRDASPGTITIELYATSSGLPTGSALASGTTNGNTLTADLAGEEREITWGTPYILSTGTMYAIVVSYSGGGSGSIYFRQDSGAGYAGGTCILYDGGWSTLASDGYFKMYGDDAGTAYTIDINAGTFTLTGKDISVNKALNITPTTGQFTLSVKDILITKALNIATAVGQFVLTGKDIVISFVKGWGFQTKNTASYTNQTKNTASWTEETKNNSSWVFENKSMYDE